MNVYFINESPRTLIDAGIKTGASFEALKQGMEVLGFRLNSIERILITHGHIDHYGQAQKISALSGAQIFIHPLEYDRTRLSFYPLDVLKIILLRNGASEALVSEVVRCIESWQDFADPLEEAFFLEEGSIIPFESMSLEAIHCPGHSPGLLSFYCKERKILFTGDHLLKEITPNPILDISTQSPPFQYTSLKRYISSLKRIIQMDITLSLPGHGEVIDDLKSLIQKVFKHHEERMNCVLSILSTGEKSPYDISMELFPGVQSFDVFLGISEALGHLEILKEQNKVKVIERKGRDYYMLGNF
jgi:glyoxylase-like metal-dependent hydrolase (beta-lactamase superfamily II)